jgi:tRNA pseudouridine38-40 synthase
MKYFLEVAYLGTNFHGWQIQPLESSIQGDLEAALSLILGEKITLMGSSRTDTGVHAMQQFAHFNTSQKIKDIISLKNRLNGYLHSDISIIRFCLVSPACHSRFNAISRKYIYRIIETKDPFVQGFAALYFKNLSLDLLNEASKKLLIHTDFKSFSRVKTSVTSFECQIEEAYWIKNGSVLEFHIQANRFLRGMVRAIVGTLLDVGIGKIETKDFENIILAKDRTKAGIAAKSEGLTLEKVNYPENYFNMEFIIEKALKKDSEIVKELFIKYQENLGISLCFQNFDEELERFSEIYGEPNGTILLAKDRGIPVGIVALKKLEEGICEMKRLFVIPEYQGYGIGRQLAEKLLEIAKSLGYKKIKLDTLERLKSAVGLYKSLDFNVTKPYNYNPEEDIIYFEKEL